MENVHPSLADLIMVKGSEFLSVCTVLCFHFACLNFFVKGSLVYDLVRSLSSSLCILMFTLVLDSRLCSARWKRAQVQRTKGVPITIRGDGDRGLVSSEEV